MSTILNSIFGRQTRRVTGCIENIEADYCSHEIGLVNWHNDIEKLLKNAFLQKSYYLCEFAQKCLINGIVSMKNEFENVNTNSKISEFISDFYASLTFFWISIKSTDFSRKFNIFFKTFQRCLSCHSTIINDKSSNCLLLYNVHSQDMHERHITTFISTFHSCFVNINGDIINSVHLSTLENFNTIFRA